MKKKVLILIASVVLLTTGVISMVNAQVQKPALATGDYSCTVTSTCGSNGSVSCSGQTCKRGWMWVECDGNRTDC